MEFGVWGVGFGVWGLGFGVWGSGFRVQGAGCRVQGAGFSPPPRTDATDLLQHLGFRIGVEAPP